MKRLMTMLLSLAMLLSLCACGQSSHGDADNCPMCVQPPSALTVTYKMIVTVC